MQRSLPPSLFATGRTIRHLRTEIEDATGCVLEFPRRADATGAVWGRDAVAARVLAGIGRPAVVVEAGPLLSPYDTPATGLSSLRIRFGGAPVDSASSPASIL